MDLADKLSGLDMHLYNAEDGPYQSDSDTEDVLRGHQGPEQPSGGAGGGAGAGGGPKQPGDDTFDEKEGRGPAVARGGGSGADDEWEVVPRHPDWDVVPRHGGEEEDAHRAREPQAPSLNADWVVCEKGRDGEVQMFEGQRVENTNASPTSSEKSASLPGPGESVATRPEIRGPARPDPGTLSQIACDSQPSSSRVLKTQTQIPPPGQALSSLTAPIPAPLRRSYERVRPGNMVRRRAKQSAPDDKAREDQPPHPPQSIPLRIPTSRNARPSRNPNINRPLSPDEKELPFLAPRPAAAAAARASTSQKHGQIAAQLRAQADREQHAALTAEQQRMDDRLERTERAMADWYGLPHGYGPHFY
ncbi:hypothetical protein CLAIMM_01647 [Cladophialophora immunda]|nr:hypothetical protein CLAIMM_01647 [Cladophialophora immunda]